MNVWAEGTAKSTTTKGQKLSKKPLQSVQAIVQIVLQTRNMKFELLLKA